MSRILDELRSDEHYDPNSLGSSLTHLQHMFEGYRARVMHTDRTFDPAGGYSPGSARRFSYDAGVAMAEADMAARRNAERER
jgi:hypothetical protein